METVESAYVTEKEWPRIEFTAPAKTFERLFKDQSFTNLRTAVAKKLGVESSAKIEFIQLRDGKAIVLEDDDDFDAFKAYAFRKGFVNVKINVVAPAAKKKSTTKEGGPTPEPNVNGAAKVVPVAPDPTGTVEITRPETRGPLPSATVPAAGDADAQLPVGAVDSGQPGVGTIASKTPAPQIPGPRSKNHLMGSPLVQPDDTSKADSETAAVTQKKSTKPRKKAGNAAAKQTNVESDIGATESETAAPTATKKRSKQTTKDPLFNGSTVPGALIEPGSAGLASIPQVQPVPGTALTTLPAASTTMLPTHNPDNGLPMINASPSIPETPVAEPVQKKTTKKKTNATSKAETEVKKAAAPPAPSDEPQQEAEKLVKKRGRPKKVVQEQSVATEPPTEEPKDIRTDVPTSDRAASAEQQEANTAQAAEPPAAPPKKRGRPKKVVDTVEGTPGGEGHTGSEVDAAPEAAPQQPDGEPPAKKKKATPKKKVDVPVVPLNTEEINAASVTPVIAASHSNTPKETKVPKKRKKADVQATENADPNAAKKRKLAPEDTPTAQVADANEPYVGFSSEGRYSLNFSGLSPKQIPRKKSTRTEEEGMDQEEMDGINVLDAKFRKRLRDEKLAMEAAERAEAARAATEDARVACQKELQIIAAGVEKDLRDEGPAGEATERAARGDSRASDAGAIDSNQGELLRNAHETDPTAMTVYDKTITTPDPPSLAKSPKKRSQKVVKPKEVIVGDEHDEEEPDDEDRGDHANEPPYPAQRQPTDFGSASTTEVESFEDNDLDELRSGSPDLPRIEQLRSASSESESDADSDLDAKPSPIMRKTMPSTPARPSITSAPSLRDIANKSTKDMFSSPRDTPRPRFAATQPTKSTASFIPGSDSDSSSSESEDDEDEVDDAMAHIPKEKRAGHKDPGARKSFVAVMGQFFGTQ